MKKQQGKKEKGTKEGTMGVIRGQFAEKNRNKTKQKKKRSAPNFSRQHKMPKQLLTWSHHGAQTGELLRSSVDLIHYDCYTNGINKGKTAILKHWIFHPLSSCNPPCVCVCACAWVCVAAHPHHVIAIRSSLFSRLGVQCRWIATFCTV